MQFHGINLVPGSEISNLKPELIASSLPSTNLLDYRIIGYSGDGSNPAGFYVYDPTLGWQRLPYGVNLAGYLAKDGSTALTGTFNANNNKIANLAAPTTGTDAVNKNYADNLLTGNVATATKLATARAISMSGDLTWTVNFDGSGSATAVGTLATVATAGTYTKVTINAKGLVVSGTSMTSADITSSLGYTPVNKAGDAMIGVLSLVADPTNALEAATKQYVDALVQGFRPKTAVRVATTANITLSGTQTVDGVVLVVGDTVLVKDQTTTSSNGIYVVAAGAWARSTDMNTWAKVAGAYTNAKEGTVNADSFWVCTSDDGGTLGTTAIVWSQFSGAGQITAGAGLTKTGNTLSLIVSGVTAGTYSKVTVDVYGRVTTGTTLTSGDVITALGFTPLNSASATLTAALNAGNFKITNLGTPTAATDAATKGYVDGQRFIYTSGAAAVTHTITHSLGVQHLSSFVCIDPATNQQFIPYSVTFNSTTQVTVVLSASANLIATMRI